MADNLNLDGQTKDLNLETSTLDLGSGTIDLGLGPAIKKPPTAFEAGIDKMLASQSRAGAIIAEKVGATDTAKSLQQYSQEKYDEYAKFSPKVASYKDIHSVGNLMDYVGENLAVGSPEIAAMFFGRLGLVANAASYFGDTVNEQIERGEGVNINRALITAGGESLLNLPLTKAFKGILAKLDRTALTEEAKNGVVTGLIKNATVDGGTNGAQAVLREYGVSGEINTEDLDEAVIGGIITTAPIRLAEATVNKAHQRRLSDTAADHVVESGNITEADGFIQSALNFTVGTAMRPVRRFLAQTEAGKELTQRIENMRIERETMANGLTQRINNLFAVRDAEAMRDAYARGDRSTPELRELQSIMDDVHSRANSKAGAGLDTGFINNYLPTNFDAERFDKQSLKEQYRLWFDGQKDKTDLITPEDANAKIEGFAKSLDEKHQHTARMPRATMDAEGNIVAGNPVNASSPIKFGQLEKTRQLGFIPQHILNDHAINRNFKEQMLNYVQSASHRVTYAEQLGKNNEVMNGLIAQMNQQRGEGSQPMTYKEFNTFYDAMDAYQGTYGQFENATARKFATALRSVANVVALPLTALSSLTEPFNLAIKVGNVAAGKAFAKALGSMSRDLISTFTNGIVDKSEVNRQLLMTGRSFKNATTALNNRIQGEHLSPFLQNFNNAFFHATGQTTINYLVNSMAVHAMDAQVKTDINTVASRYPNSRAYQDAVGRLNELGVSATLAQAMHKDPSIIAEYKPSMVARFNRDVSLDPQALDKPLWHSTGWGAMFAQLRGYPTMFANTVLPNLYRVIDPRGKSASEIAIDTARFGTTVGAILTVGFLQESMKNELRGNNQTDEEILMKAYRNTLAPIHHTYVTDAAQGKLERLFVPVSVSIFDQQVKNLAKAVNGEGDLDKLPILSSFKGL